MRYRLYALALCAALAVGAAGVPRTPALRILFVGNSLTYENDLPGMVKRLAERNGQRVETAVAAYPNYSLEDHLHDRRTLPALRDKPWDVVVLQQGPSALESSRQQLVRDTRAFAELLHGFRHRPRIALLMVWPSRARADDFPRVAESYRIAAEAVSGLLIPAGEAWRKIHADIELYAADGFHPSEAGTYLTALAVYRALFGSAPKALPGGHGLTDSQRRALATAVE